MASSNPSPSRPHGHASHSDSFQGFPLWREFLWGGLAGAFGEGIMHPVDTTKTRIQSAVLVKGCQASSIHQMVKAIWTTDGFRGFYRGVSAGLTGSLATGATYFGIIESTKSWISRKNPNLEGHWAHFLAGAVGDTLGSFIYVPCEVIKQRMQVQGTKGSWYALTCKNGSALNPSSNLYGYYSGIFQAGTSIVKHEGLRGLYEGYWSTLARDVPFAGLMVMFYEGLKDAVNHGKRRWRTNSRLEEQNSIEGLVLGGIAGGVSAYITTPLDVVKTRLQVQGSVKRYDGWLDAVQKIWQTEGAHGFFKGSVPRVLWYIPASAFTFMAVEFLREHFNKQCFEKVHDAANISLEKNSPISEGVFELNGKSSC